jgi:hypothetical protein
LILSVLEVDNLDNDSYTIFIPCETVGKQSFDISLAAFKVQAEFDNTLSYTVDSSTFDIPKKSKGDLL